MLKLEAINLMLTQGAGQDPVNSVEEGDETVARVLNVFDRVLKEVLASPWPFNEDTVDLTQQTDGTVKIPVDEYLWVELPDPYVIRDGKVFHPKNQTHVLNRSFNNTKIARNLTIDQFDHTAGTYVAWMAAAEYAASRDPSSARAAYCQAKANIWEKKMALKYPAQIANDNPQDSLLDPRLGLSSAVRRIDCT